MAALNCLQGSDEEVRGNEYMLKAGLAGIERIGRDNAGTPDGFWYL